MVCACLDFHRWSEAAGGADEFLYAPTGFGFHVGLTARATTMLRGLDGFTSCGRSGRGLQIVLDSRKDFTDMGPI